ncbi:neoverrucotoxin subunit alpha-like [Hyla sarda]|uniref:neoverrucotoxin subunit alpha-like n=1 Tax=Hyla sarda TaxID=327740 RepID=UPI0024C34FE3|nr:neoverrucotoxin subunit alpha-like [Hyla sarda]
MTLEIPSLGRPFTLGMLYDAREEKIIPGITLWNNEDLNINISTISVQSQNSTDFEVLTSDSFYDKSSALDLSGELKISVLSGMVNVGGSGKFLNDTKESKKQARVTLKYKRTTRFDQLSMKHLSYKNITYKEVFSKKIATHVVTGILYGAQAFFIFDQKVTNSEEVKDVQGKLEGMVMKIGELRGDVNVNDTEREVASQISCKFYGHIALERNPTTYEEAVEIYAKICTPENQCFPNRIGRSGSEAVPLKIWLHPLKDLDSSAARLVQEISDHLVFTAEEMMQEMSEVIMECNDMMGHPAAMTFPALANKIRQFKKHFQHFRIMFQKKLSQVLSSVRGEYMEESSLEEFLTGKEKSPFSDQKIRTFLHRRWTEMDYVHSIFTKVTKYRLVTEQRELIKEIYDPNYDSTWCFNFSLGNKDLYLSHLESWLYKEPWDYQEISSDGETKEWFEEKGISKIVKEHVRNFDAAAMEATSMKFLVTSVVCSAGPGIILHEYCNGDPVTNYCTCSK